MAAVAAQRGAQVTLVAAHTAELPDPAAVEVVRVGSAAELREAVLSRGEGRRRRGDGRRGGRLPPGDRGRRQDQEGRRRPAAVAAADQPGHPASSWSPAAVPGQVVVGFAAETGDETGDALHHGRAKLARKGCDLLVVNAVGDGRAFEVPDNAGWLLGADGSERELAVGSKALLASHVWDAVAVRLSAAQLIAQPRCHPVRLGWSGAHRTDGHHRSGSSGPNPPRGPEARRGRRPCAGEPRGQGSSRRPRWPASRRRQARPTHPSSTLFGGPPHPNLHPRPPSRSASWRFNEPGCSGCVAGERVHRKG